MNRRWLTIANLFTMIMVIAASSYAEEQVVNHPAYPVKETPQLPLVVYDEEFANILGQQPKLHHLAEGFGFTEGPVYLRLRGRDEGYLLFTDQINDTIWMMRWLGLKPYNAITALSWTKPVVYRHPSSIADGQTLDLQGRLLTAETTGRRVSITDFDGKVKTLVGFYEGKPLNSPNDLVVKSDGSVWFTDPSYGCLQFPQECYLPNNVYRFDVATKELTAVITNLQMPNGIAFSPDEKTLYVIDSGAIQAPRTYYPNNPHAIYAFDVEEGGKRVGPKRLFTVVEPGFPDGMRLDSRGNLYVGALDGVHIYNKEAKLIGKILLPKETANLTFGGTHNNILFICSSDSIWAIKLNAQGAKPLPEIDL